MTTATHKGAKKKRENLELCFLLVRATMQVNIDVGALFTGLGAFVEACARAHKTTLDAAKDAESTSQKIAYTEFFWELYGLVFKIERVLNIVFQLKKEENWAKLTDEQKDTVSTIIATTQTFVTSLDAVTAGIQANQNAFHMPTVLSKVRRVEGYLCKKRRCTKTQSAFEFISSLAISLGIPDCASPEEGNIFTIEQETWWQAVGGADFDKLLDQ